MERYELKSGLVYEIIRYSDECVVVNSGSVVYSGTYSGCRRFIKTME